ncbi:hypothetical protein V6Z11_D01G110100 [Gossypium hirsutum]
MVSGDGLSRPVLVKSTGIGRINLAFFCAKLVVLRALSALQMHEETYGALRLLVVS